MTNTDWIGRGFRFEFTGEQQRPSCVWICFARSPDNPAILRLAPAIPADRLQVDGLKPDGSECAAKLVDQDGAERWLVGGIEVRLHEVDLDDPGVVTAAGIFKIADQSGPTDAEWFPNTEPSPAFDDFIDRLSLLAMEITERIHENVQEKDYPALEDCQIAEINPEEKSARLYWRHDRDRGYRFRAQGCNWTLQQYYDDPGWRVSDLEVPLRIGAEWCRFSPDGLAPLSLALAQQVGKVFGLPFPAQPTPRRVSTSLRWTPPASAPGALRASGEEAGPVPWVEPRKFSLANGTIRGLATLERGARGAVLELSLEADAPARVRWLLRDPPAAEQEREIEAVLGERTTPLEPGVILYLWEQRLAVGAGCVGFDLAEEEDQVVLNLVYDPPAGQSDP